MEPTPAIPGLVLVRHPRREDERGSFSKLLHPTDLDGLPGATLPVREMFTSWSRPGVLRGMHFQAPPADHVKLVTCLSGSVLDVVLDLRRSSPTFGRHRAFRLDGGEPTALVIPRGCAHGFAVLGDAPALMAYAVSHEHAPAHDLGVRWDSFGCEWPLANPQVSARDRSLPALAELGPVFP